MRPSHRRLQRHQHRRHSRLNSIPIPLHRRNLPNRPPQLLRVMKIHQVHARDRLRRDRIRVQLRQQRNPRQNTELRPRIEPIHIRRRVRLRIPQPLRLRQHLRVVRPRLHLRQDEVASPIHNPAHPHNLVPRSALAAAPESRAPHPPPPPHGSTAPHASPPASPVPPPCTQSTAYSPSRPTFPTPAPPESTAPPGPIPQPVRQSHPHLIPAPLRRNPSKSHPVPHRSPPQTPASAPHPGYKCASAAPGETSTPPALAPPRRPPSRIPSTQPAPPSHPPSSSSPASS